MELLLYAFCPLCIGIALGGSVFSRFLPTGKAYMISGLWMGFLLFALIQFLYNRVSFFILAEMVSFKRLLKRVLFYMAFLGVYLFLVFVQYLVNGRNFRLSWFLEFNGGYLFSQWAYELYHVLSDRGMRIRYGNIWIPMGLNLFASLLIYLLG